MNVLKFTVAIGEPYQSWAMEHLGPHGFRVFTQGIPGEHPKMVRYYLDTFCELEKYDAVLYVDADVKVMEPDRLFEMFVPNSFAAECHTVGEDAYGAYVSASMRADQYKSVRNRVAINSGVWCLEVESYIKFARLIRAARQAFWNNHDQALVNALMIQDEPPFAWDFFDPTFIGSWKQPGGIITHYNGNHGKLEETPVAEEEKTGDAVTPREIEIWAGSCKDDVNCVGKIALPCSTCESTKRADEAEGKLAEIEAKFREVFGG